MRVIQVMEDGMIRPVTISDAREIAGIYNHYIQHSIATFEEHDVSAGEMKSRIDAVINAGYPWLVCEDGERICGYAYANRWNPRAAYRHTAEVTIYLAEGDVSKGAGTALYEALFSRLEEMWVHAVVGGITLPNPASVAIHEKFGMKKVAHFEAVGRKFGEWLDVAYWEVILSS